jgi:hypothetical protein
MAKEYFEEWYPTGGEFFDNYRFNLSQGRNNNAAFQLHQATERLYHTALLVVTFYTPLCRARHKGVYAAPHTMPMATDFARLT